MKLFFIAIMLVMIGTDFIAAQPLEQGSRDLHPAEISQPVPTVFRVGIELGDYSTHKSGSYKNTPGFSAGLATGFDLYSDKSGSIALGLEGGYTRIIDFYLQAPQKMYESYSSHGYIYLDTYDERYQLSFVEIGLLPQYIFPISEKITLSLYTGGSFGIGKEFLQTNRTSRILVDSIGYYGFTDYGPYGEYNMGLRSVGIFNLGASFFYKDVMIGLRYRYTNMSDTRKYKNLYLQFGIVL